MIYFEWLIDCNQLNVRVSKFYIDEVINLIYFKLIKAEAINLIHFKLIRDRDNWFNSF